LVRGYEFLINEGNVFRNQEQVAREGTLERTRIRQCSGCRQPLGIISSMLYEIDEKQYCSECYSRMISNNAAERDHSDIMQAKEA